MPASLHTTETTKVCGRSTMHGEKVYDQCIAHNVEFIFGQTGNVFVKDDRTYHIRDRKTQIDQVLASGLHIHKEEPK